MLQPKITDEAALKATHPELFSVNLSKLKKMLLAAKTLGQTIPGAELEEVVIEKKADNHLPDFISRSA